MAKTLYEYCVENAKANLLEEWMVTKNDGLSPHDVSYGSHRMVWWLCEKGHEWRAVVYTRTLNNTGCPYCAGKKVMPGEGTLATKYPELAKQWHPTKNSGLDPNAMPPGSGVKVWWRCEKGHEWEARINSRVSGARCPVCCNHAVMAGVNDFVTRYPSIAAQWHPTKNGTLKPSELLPGAKIKVWWRCERGHEWQTEVRSRTHSGSGCPYCAGKQVKPGLNDLASVFPQIAAQWHPEKNGMITPEEVTAFSNLKYWWLCEKGHEYQAVVSSRTARGSGCPYCVNRKVLAGYNDLATKEPKIAGQWHPELNGNLTPQMVSCGSRKNVWWLCDEGHAWQAVIYSRTGLDKNGCPVCAGRVSERKRKRYEEIITANNKSKRTDLK